MPWLHKAGYMVHITDDVWDSAAYSDAATAMRNQNVPAPPPAVAAARTTERPPGTRRR
ncbi:hypothetical protein RI578_09860 [Streptomyces sp. BB1-1-1]|uniref:hypothetical protein n=1 Tax=Streptomyces sp. BB1-1-1 TaxID=3074430 RepID=UPI002877E4E7|nr:hypothetical protein [Streptomyces sp. BB1-1-1]WND34573.1 hypothetical protein RI578_09860 [Streptomyces sp. BB1-1-1]